MFNLPRLIIMALAATAIWYGYKVVKREMGRVREELRKSDNDDKQVQPLEKDENGVYRLKDD